LKLTSTLASLKTSRLNIQQASMVQHHAPSHPHHAAHNRRT
jgi:hypothetical protein